MVSLRKACVFEAMCSIDHVLRYANSCVLNSINGCMVSERMFGLICRFAIAHPLHDRE